LHIFIVGILQRVNDSIILINIIENTQIEWSVGKYKMITYFYPKRIKNFIDKEGAGVKETENKSFLF